MSLLIILLIQDLKASKTRKYGKIFEAIQDQNQKNYQYSKRIFKTCATAAVGQLADRCLEHSHRPVTYR